MAVKGNFWNSSALQSQLPPLLKATFFDRCFDRLIPSFVLEFIYLKNQRLLSRRLNVKKYYSWIKKSTFFLVNIVFRLSDFFRDSGLLSLPLVLDLRSLSNDLKRKREEDVRRKQTKAETNSLTNFERQKQTKVETNSLTDFERQLDKNK